jgi:hypothetical protein
MKTKYGNPMTFFSTRFLAICKLPPKKLSFLISPFGQILAVKKKGGANQKV